MKILIKIDRSHQKLKGLGRLYIASLLLPVRGLCMTIALYFIVRFDDSGFRCTTVLPGFLVNEPLENRPPGYY